MLQRCVRAVARCAQETSSGVCRPFSSLPTPSAIRLQQLEDIRELNDFFPNVVEDLKEHGEVCKIPSETEWFAKLLNYTVPGGKMCRGLTGYNAMKHLAGPGNLTDEYMYKAKSIAWSIEMMQAAVLVSDDMADNDRVRRGKESWFVVAGGGAATDAILLTHAAYQLLKRHYGGTECYQGLLQMYIDTFFKYTFGQNLDIHCIGTQRAVFDDFSMQRYKEICEYKAGEYSFYMPTAAAMIVHGIHDFEAHKIAMDLSFDVGLLYQSQNDYLDCYGPVELTGKPGSDIKEGKCSWLIAAAKDIADKRQLEILKENYGFQDQAKVDTVVAIYNELDMKKVFLDYNRTFSERIREKTKRSSNKLPAELFEYALETIGYHWV